MRQRQQQSPTPPPRGVLRLRRRPRRRVAITVAIATTLAMVISWCSNSFSFAVVVVRAQQSQQQQVVVASSSNTMNLRGLASEDIVSNTRENNDANRVLLGSDRKKKNSDKQNQDDDNNNANEEEKIRSENKKRKEVNEKLREKAATKDKLAREKQDGEKKQQKQKQKKDKKEKDNADKKKGKMDDDKKKDKKKKKDNEEDDDDDKKKPNKLSAKLPTTPNKGKKDQNNDNGKNDDNKKPSKKDDDGNSGKVQPKNDSKHQGHGDKPSKKDEDAASSSQKSSVVVSGRNKWKFVNALSDSSIPLDSFEEGDDGNTNFDLLEWTSTSRNPWITSSQHAQDGKSSMVSGITSLVYDQGPSGGGSQPVYSNLTLSTDSNFKGGVLTFRLLAKSLTLPRESFFVTVDGNIELPPEEVITRSSSTLAANTWAEYSVPVGRGEHKVTWVHAYNPFALKVLPSVGGEDDVGLWMDDLRLVPFTSSANLDPLEVINGGGFVGGNTQDVPSPWEVSKDGSTIVASSSDVQGNRGSANIQFELYSKMGAMLTYRVKTSTSGPHDDFAILFNNNDVVATTMFGDMLGFESRSLAIPKGKVVVTLSHRKNPGRLDRTLLDSLGEIGTEGRTWLESFSLNLN